MVERLRGKRGLIEVEEAAEEEVGSEDSVCSARLSMHTYDVSIEQAEGTNIRLSVFPILLVSWDCSKGEQVRVKNSDEARFTSSFIAVQPKLRRFSKMDCASLTLILSFLTESVAGTACCTTSSHLSAKREIQMSKESNDKTLLRKL